MPAIHGYNNSQKKILIDRMKMTAIALSKHLGCNLSVIIDVNGTKEAASAKLTEHL